MLFLYLVWWRAVSAKDGCVSISSVLRWMGHVFTLYAVFVFVMMTVLLS